MPPTITNMGQLAELIQQGGMTPTLAPLALIAIGTGGALAQARELPHFWQVARDPGHFDTLDDKCVEAVNRFAAQFGTDQWGTAEVEHLNEWPNDQKEEFRQLLCAYIIKDRPLPIRWMAKRMIRKAAMAVDADGVLFTQPAATR